MDAVAQTSSTSHTHGPVIASAFRSLIDLYWLTQVSFRNVLEDIAGADGRIEYLISLRARLIEVCLEMDDLLSGASVGVTEGHRLAVALERGMPHFDVSARDLVERLCFARPEIMHEELQTALLAFGESFVRRLPGHIPDAQGPLGQGQIIRAMRNWSIAAEKTGDDLSFLSERFRRL